MLLSQVAGDIPYEGLALGAFEQRRGDVHLPTGLQCGQHHLQVRFVQLQQIK